MPGKRKKKPIFVPAEKVVWNPVTLQQLPVDLSSPDGGKFGQVATKILKGEYLIVVRN